jgi:hypothetical protein
MAPQDQGFGRGLCADATNISTVTPGRWMPLTDLSFNGMRFLDRSVELGVGQELANFQRLVTDVAGYLWRKENPQRERLPARFEEKTKLRFSRIDDGSTVLPLDAPVDMDEESLFGEQPLPQLDWALKLIVDAISSQQQHRELPPDFPRDCIQRIVDLGETLQDDESISVGDGEKRVRKKATINKATRQRFRDYQTSNYDDVVRLYGEIRAVDLDGPTAQLRMPDDTRIAVTFNEDQEAVFKRHLRQAVALEGIASISKMDGFIRRIRSVTQITPIEAIEGEDPLLAWLKNPDVKKAWSVLPRDAATNLDKYLYGESLEEG